jgi:hypothetical protein
VATREQVTALLDQGLDYEAAARALGIPPGRAFMIATGAPAETGDQDLVNPPAHNPTRNEEVMEWVRGRAARELTRE